MRRIAVKLVVFLVLGALVNVAVAWGCALWIDLKSPSVSRLKGLNGPTPEYMQWDTRRWETSGALRVVSVWDYRGPGRSSIITGFFDPSTPSSDSLVPPWADYLHPLHGEPNRGRYNWVADARGWPLLSKWGGSRSRTRASS